MDKAVHMLFKGTIPEPIFKLELR